MKKSGAWSLAVFFLFIQGGSLRAEVRDWTRASDGKKISAEFAGMKDETTVKIKVANGQIYEVPVTSLSAEDQTLIKELAAKEMKPAAGTGAATPGSASPGAAAGPVPEPSPGSTCAAGTARMPWPRSERMKKIPFPPG